MHRISHVLRAVESMCWAILPEKLEALCAVLELRANGEHVPPELVAANAAAPRRASLAAAPGGSAVAVIPVFGIIAPRMNLMTEMSGGTSAEQLVSRVRAAVENPQIGAIILDVDSPGGSVAGVEEAAAAIFALRGTKPIVSVANHLIASAAYWIASAADEVIASPSAEVGSIGCFTVHTDVSGADQQTGVTRTLVRAGAHKAEDLPFFALSDDARAAMQAKVDAYYDRFVAAIAAHRGVSVETVRETYGQGRTLDARAALAAGMVDRLATLDDVIAEYTGGAVAGGSRARAELQITPLAADGELPEDQGAEESMPAHCPECGAPLDGDGACPECGYAPEAAAAGGSAVSGFSVAASSAHVAPASGARAPAPVRRIPMQSQSPQSPSPSTQPSTPAPQARRVTVSERNPAAHDGADTLSREEEIRQIGALAQTHAMQDKLPKWLEQNAPLASVKTEIIAELKDRLAKGPRTKARVELTAAEEQRYSYTRAMLSALDGTASFERDIHEELAKKVPLGYKPQGGFFMPTTLRGEGVTDGRIMAAGLDSGTATKGTELKYVQYGGFIDLLRNKSRVLQAGARMLSGLDGPVTFTKQTGAGTFSWVGENSGADVAESNLLLGTVSLQAKTGQSTTSFSRQLLRQAVEDVEQLVRNDLAAIHALGIDLAALAGTGAGNQPTGVYNTAGVGVVSLGTNGGAPTFNALINQQVQVAVANADDIGAGAYITTPGIKGSLQIVAKLANTISQAVWGDDDRVANKPGYDTNQVQSNLTKGTGTNLHAIYYGIWQQLLIGEWGAMEVLVDPFRLKKQGMIEVTSFQMIDVMVRYAAAFSLIKDAISTF